MLALFVRLFALLAFLADSEANILAGGVRGSDLHWSRVPAHANPQGGTKTSTLLRGARASALGSSLRDGNTATSRPGTGLQTSARQLSRPAASQSDFRQPPTPSPSTGAYASSPSGVSSRALTSEFCI